MKRFRMYILPPTCSGIHLSTTTLLMMSLRHRLHRLVTTTTLKNSIMTFTQDKNYKQVDASSSDSTTITSNLSFDIPALIPPLPARAGLLKQIDPRGAQIW
jgi:hypothetical protein